MHRIALNIMAFTIKLKLLKSVSFQIREYTLSLTTERNLHWCL